MYILNIWVHKILFGLFLQWSTSLAGKKKNQYQLLIFDVN